MPKKPKRLTPSPAAEFQLAGARAQREKISRRVTEALAELRSQLDEGLVDGPLTMADFLRHAKVERKTLKEGYHAESYALVIDFLVSTGGKPRSPSAKPAVRTTSYYKAMKAYAAGAEGAKLEVRRLEKLLAAADEKILLLTASKKSGRKTDLQLVEKAA